MLTYSMNVIIVSLVGGLLCLDRVVLQTAVCRPVVAAPLTGWLLGDAYTGLVVSAFLELFWIDRLPLGTYIPPNETVAAILTAAGAILAGRALGSLPPALITLAVLLFLPLGIAAQQLERWHCRRNERAALAALADAGRGDGWAIARRHRLAILRYYSLATGLIVVALPLGVLALSWGFPRLPGFATRGLTLLYGVLPLIGCAAALQTIPVRRAVPIFCALFLVSASLLAWWR